MRRLLPALPLLLLASPAAAHLPPGEYGSFAAGVSHPLFGADHVLAMVAVGIWAGLLGGRAALAVPAAFVGAMILGFVLALAGLPLPAVEPMILASTVAIGLAAALALRLDLRACAAFVGLFAVFHGHAHGGELGEAGALRFGLGFVLGAAALQGAGLALALGAARFGRTGRLASRAFGAAAAGGGLMLAFG